MYLLLLFLLLLCFLLLLLLLLLCLLFTLVLLPAEFLVLPIWAVWDPVADPVEWDAGARAGAVEEAVSDGLAL